jgi:hypothetical protein
MFSTRKIVLFIVLLITVCITAYILIVYIPSQLAQKTYDGARQIGKDISDAFHVTPEVTINNTVVLQQQSPLFELATLSQTFRHEYEWQNKWLGSTKKIRIKGTFTAKAGFDLHSKFSVQFRDDEALVILPNPKLLSLTPGHDVSFEDENGIWNRLTEQDRSAAMNAFTRDAEQFARKADFVEQAKINLEKRLREIFTLHGKKLTIRYEESPIIQPM